MIRGLLLPLVWILYVVQATWRILLRGFLTGVFETSTKRELLNHLLRQVGGYLCDLHAILIRWRDIGELSTLRLLIILVRYLLAFLRDDNNLARVRFSWNPSILKLDIGLLSGLGLLIWSVRVQPMVSLEKLSCEHGLAIGVLRIAIIYYDVSRMVRRNREFLTLSLWVLLDLLLNQIPYIFIVLLA